MNFERQKIQFPSAYCQKHCNPRGLSKPPRVNFLPSRTPTRTTATVVGIPSKPAPSLKELVPPQYHDYLDVFEKPKPQTLPPRRYVDHVINLEPGAKPPFQPLFNTSKKDLEFLRNYTDDMLK